MITQTPPAPTQKTSPQPALERGLARPKDPISGLPAPINAAPGFALGLAIGLLGVLAFLLV